MLLRAAATALLGLALVSLAPAGFAQSGPGKEKPRDLPPTPDGGLPDGTQRIRLAVGGSHPLALPGGTQVICDAPSVAKMEFVSGQMALVGVGPGATLCGARLAGAMKGLWYVVVDAK
jgi:hypothetical protein